MTSTYKSSEIGRGRPVQTVKTKADGCSGNVFPVAGRRRLRLLLPSLPPMVMDERPPTIGGALRCLDYTSSGSQAERIL